LFWSAVAITLLAAGGQFIASNDLHIFMLMGQSMEETGVFMDVEQFTWTAQGTEFLHGPWGFSVLSWKIYSLAGLVGLRLFNGLLAALTVTLIGRAAVLRGADYRAAAFSCLFCFAMLFQNLSIRAQTWVYPLFAALIWWLARPRPTRWSVPFALSLGCIWANLHGSFPAALVLIGLVGLGQAWQDRSVQAAKPAAWIALAFLVGTCIGPNGPEIYSYVLSNSGLPEARGLSEWSNPEFLSVKGGRLGLALVLWTVLILKKPRAMEARDLLPVLAFAGLALTGTRFISWFGMAASVPLAVRLSLSIKPSPGMTLAAYRRFALVLGLCWSFMLVRGLWPRDQELRSETPVAAVDALAASADGGRLLNPPEYGGYARFILGANWKTSGDIRVWIFDDEAWFFYPRLAQAPSDWEQRLDKAGVTHLLLIPEPFHDGLIEKAKASPRWKLLAEDETGLAFKRRNSVN